MSKICKFYQSGNCRSGSECRFLHEIKTEKSSIVFQLIKKDIKSAELSQLERKFRSTFKKVFQDDSTEVVEFDMVPSDPDFPFELDALKISLTIFHDYPVSSALLKIRNSEIPEELIAKVEQGWKSQFDGNKRIILLDQLKWLDRNLEQLLISKDSKKEEAEPSIRFFKPDEIKVTIQPDEEDEELVNQSANMIDDLNIKDEQVKPSNSNVSKNSIHKGTQIRVPKVQLVNIGLLKCICLNISLNCSRCKGTIDARLSPNAIDCLSAGEDWLTCPVCNLSVGARYRSDLVHSGSTSIGYLDLSEDASIRDISPSSFVVSCMDGHETSYGLKSVLTGVEYRVSCQQCFSSMKLVIDQFKFVKLSPNVMKVKQLQLKKPKRNNQDLGISIGTPLPNNGTCEHYKKSYRYFIFWLMIRWLRFPCCSKVFPCDICHELKKDDGHEMLWANRMICGFCSKG